MFALPVVPVHIYFKDRYHNGINGVVKSVPESTLRNLSNPGLLGLTATIASTITTINAERQIY